MIIDKSKSIELHIKTHHPNIHALVQDVTLKNDVCSITISYKGEEGIKLDCMKAAESIKESFDISDVRFIAIKNSSQLDDKSRHNTTKASISGVEKTIAIVSGKGGVGKSTVAGCLSLVLSRMQDHVSLLDADIHGPSIGRVLGISNSKVIINKKGTISPIKQDKIQFLSSSLFMSGDDALIWRGPMASKMLHKLLHEAEWRFSKLLRWANSDVLIIDTPPGTGDIHISLFARNKIDGIIFVSTPNQIAIDDTHRSIAMAKSTNTPILGIVENMAFPGEEKSKLEEYAEANNIKYFGKIYYSSKISDDIDSGISYKQIAANDKLLSTLQRISKSIIDS